jgi:hypothetical protein
LGILTSVMMTSRAAERDGQRFDAVGHGLDGWPYAPSVARM